MKDTVLLREGTFLGELLDIKPKEKPGIILIEGMEQSKDHWDQHPFQVKITYVAPGPQSMYDGKRGRQARIKIGDIIYLDRMPGPNDFVIVNEKILARVYSGNILCIVREQSEELETTPIIN